MPSDIPADAFIPDIALRYIKDKKLAPAFSYKDVWNEEHATSFTVAKAMQIDVLSDMKKAVEKAIAEGQSFESFKKNIKPTLIAQGWWGRRTMVDPLSGETVHAHLGSDRRLRTIYNVNLRSAYQKGQYERTMASELHPYLIYRVGHSKEHRPEHLRWNGLILPKDDPWWATHLPPNDWGCKCYTRAVSEARKARYQNDGIPLPPTVDGSDQGGILRVQTKAPKTTYRPYYNERKGTTEKLPNGVAPGFNFSPASPRDTSTAQALKAKIDKANRIFSTKFSLDDVIPLASEKAKKILDKQQPVDPKILSRVVRTLKKQGQFVGQSKDIDGYLEHQGKEAVVFSSGELLLHTKISASGLFEELIHLAQLRRLSTSDIDEIFCNKSKLAKCEIQAKEKLLKYAKNYGITDYEIDVIKDSIRFYKSRL